jgi:hypothetical protein
MPLNPVQAAQYSNLDRTSYTLYVGRQENRYAPLQRAVHGHSPDRDATLQERGGRHLVLGKTMLNASRN